MKNYTPKKNQLQGYHITPMPQMIANMTRSTYLSTYQLLITQTTQRGSKTISKNRNILPSPIDKDLYICTPHLSLCH